MDFITGQHNFRSLTPLNEHFVLDFLFGLSSRTMVPPHLITEESEELISAFNSLQKAASTRIRMYVDTPAMWIYLFILSYRGSNWPLFELFTDRMKGPRRIVDAYIMPIVNVAVEAQRSSVSSRGDDENDTKTLLEYLVKVTEGTF
jgi:hypothetical protein